MTAARGGPRFQRSPHLTSLLAEVDRLVAAIGAAEDGARAQLRNQQRDEVVRATLLLDGANLDSDDLAGGPLDPPELPATDDTTPAPYGVERRGWLDTLRTFDEPPDAHLRALEIAGVHAAEDADDLAQLLLTDPLPTLAELHRRLTRGLVAKERAGAPRSLDQAVHDGSTGRMLYFTVEIARIPHELEQLARWLTSSATDEHGLIVSGVLHHELLRIHPYDAANGRLARSAARLVLLARGLDPDHLTAPEPQLARDPLGYHEEVAGSLRRRDLTIWLERWSEAVADGLRASGRALDVIGGGIAADVATFVDTQPTFTIADYREAFAHAATPLDEALGRLLDTGRIRRVPGSRGLRFTVVKG